MTSMSLQVIISIKRPQARFIITSNSNLTLLIRPIRVDRSHQLIHIPTCNSNPSYNMHIRANTITKLRQRNSRRRKSSRHSRRARQKSLINVRRTRPHNSKRNRRRCHTSSRVQRQSKHNRHSVQTTHDQVRSNHTRYHRASHLSAIKGHKDVPYHQNVPIKTKGIRDVHRYVALPSSSK